MVYLLWSGKKEYQHPYVRELERRGVSVISPDGPDEVLTILKRRVMPVNLFVQDSAAFSYFTGCSRAIRATGPIGVTHHFLGEVLRITNPDIPPILLVHSGKPTGSDELKTQFNNSVSEVVDLSKTNKYAFADYSLRILSALRAKR